MDKMVEYIISFADEFIGLVCILMSILILYFMYNGFHRYLIRNSYLDYFEGTQLKNRFKIFLILIGILITLYISIYFYGLNIFFDYLNSIHIINNNLLKITFYSFLVSVFTVYLLYNLLIITRNIIYLYSRKKFNEDTAGSIKSVFSNVGIVIIITIFLMSLGFNWKLFVPIAGALGIGAGIGLQGILTNYFSGFILLSTRKLKIGDIVEIEGNSGRAIGNKLETIYGKIQTIDLLNTVVATVDGIEIVVPNSQFLSNQFVNYSLTDTKIRLRIPFGVSYDSDPLKVKEILLNVANENQQILKSPEPDVWFSEMSDSSLVFYLLCWVNIKFLWKLNGLVSDIYFKGWYELKEDGIVIPFPQNDVWFKNNLKIEIDKGIEEFNKNEG